MDSSEAERRRQMLDEWMRELTMSEKCMSNDDILQKVRSFVAADKTKPSTEPAGCSSTTTTAASTPSAPVPSSSSVTNSSFSPLSYGPIVDKQALFLTIRQIRKFLPHHFPVTVAQLDDMLSTGPFRLDIADFKAISGSISPTSDDQLRKDLSRDRIVVNGRRFQGGGSSSSFLQEIVDACSTTVTELMSSAQLVPLSSPSDSETFIKSLLRQLSRTESAFLSLCLLNTIVDIVPGSSEEGSNIVLVPEAMLAEPMQLTIELLERKPTSSMSKTHAPAVTTTKSANNNREYCIDCELNTSTVYRFCDDMTMSTLLQCRVVYSKRVYGMLGGSGSNITEKAGKSYLVFIRETKTTSRDWKQ